uniref:Large ribosomal subunit protein bL32c n=1 Tax=Clematis florida TaxID=231648 RepID=A0A8K1HSP6_CLEFL|nr:ribosomal protein L32 [Clematis florida]YP_010382887.1 ribosomal protein L32 [Clematis patens]YP_010439556.1 ribosomal protein L32 [Clematis cadmia]YP_010440498.1 ribosomal protein L32 [Clematis crispa]YP_010440954.1 ribosomal protein L32 [Clematis glaucophylla]YP_010442220.1 ribosomal protein L32 [Clematis reticulata]YP_010893624.1 ribosomal protein L32 [Clematis integrifolia]YP_011001788.1 ribosomal protein L32 [Clematis patens subsp. tientaiensis]UBR43301.1 ribosomal protein L32 [Clem
MAVQKKRISMSKKHIRKNFWKNKVYWAGIKAFSLAKSLSTGNSKSFFVQQTSNIIYYIIKTWKSLGIILIDMNQRIR